MLLILPGTTDGFLSDHFVSKFQGADASVGTLPPGSIVVNLNVLEYNSAHGFTGWEVFTVNQLSDGGRAWSPICITAGEWRGIFLPKPSVVELGPDDEHD